LEGITFLEALKERYISGSVGDNDEMFVVDKDSNTTKVYMVWGRKDCWKNEVRSCVWECGIQL